MYKIYFKQAIEMLKQNKFISIITIVGTALAIMMIMVIIVSQSVQNTSVAPEINRDRTMYIKYTCKTAKNKDGQESDALSYKYYKEYLSDIKSAELICAINKSWNNENMAKSENKKERIGINLMPTDANYWKLMSFNFIDGKPFSQEDFKSGIRNAVVSESTARKLLGTADAVGKSIEINFKNYKIVGVVKDVSQIFEYAHADIWIPYTSVSGYENRQYNVLFLAKSRNDFAAIDEEVRRNERKYNATDNDWTLTIWGPYDHNIQKLNIYSNVGPDTKAANRKMILIMVILLLVPAINLTSFSLSRIKRRTEEIGVRKAFGAKKYVILVQVLYENFITSLIGGFIGLLLSYIIVVWLKQWLLDVGDDTSIPLNTLVSLPIFFMVFLVCLLLNLLSAGIPAFKASKMPIVDSLTKKEM